MVLLIGGSIGIYSTTRTFVAPPLLGTATANARTTTVTRATTTTQTQTQITMTATTSTYAAAVAANGIMLGFDAQHTNNNPYEKVLNSANVSRLVQDWTFHTGGYIAASPVVASGVVYIGSRDGYVPALDAHSGEQIWTHQTGSMIDRSSPAIANGAVYIGTDGGVLYALDARLG